jgi:hypothetical protein
VSSYEPQATGPERDTAVIIKGDGDGLSLQFGDHIKKSNYSNIHVLCVTSAKNIFASWPVLEMKLLARAK